MKPTVYFLVLSMMIGMIAVWSGCGGNASPTPTASSPTPPASGTTTPPAGGGDTTTSNAPFQQAITATVNTTSVGDHGMVAVSADGDVSIQVTGAQPNASYVWSFCTFSDGCFDLGQTLLTDGSGNGRLTFHFPKTGNWAGDFHGASGTSMIDTQDAAHRSMRANLITQNGVNGSTPCSASVKPGCNLDPAQGTVTVANQVAHIVVQGGSPNTSYEVVLYGGGVTQGVINTDASGNVTADLPVLPGHGATYVFRPLNSKAGEVTGFTVK